MDTSVRIDPTFSGIINLIPCAPGREDCCGLRQETAIRLKDAFTKTLSIFSSEVKNNTFLEITKRFSVAAQKNSNTSAMFLAHSVAIETLFGKNKNEALESIANTMIRTHQLQEVAPLVKEIEATGDNATEHQLAIVKSICEEEPSQVFLALQIAKQIKSSQQKMEGLAKIAKEQARWGFIDNAELIVRSISEELPGLFPTPEEAQKFLAPLFEAINYAKNSTTQPVQPASKWDKNVAVFMRLMGMIEYSCSLRKKPFSKGEAPQGKYVLETLGLVAEFLMQEKMHLELFATVEAINNDLVDEEERKVDLNGDIISTLSYRENGDFLLEKFISHGSHKVFDVKLVKNAVQHFTSRRDLTKALAVAEKYLQGADVQEAFCIFAHTLMKNYPASLTSSLFQSSVKEKGKLLVACVEELAKKDVKHAYGLIETVRTQGASQEQNLPEPAISEDDLSEAFVRIAEAELEKKAKLEDVLERLTRTVSKEKVQKAYVRLAEELLNSKRAWQQGNELLGRLRPTISTEVLDRLLARAAIAETEASELG